MFPKTELEQMYSQWRATGETQDVLLSRVAERFGWTIGQAYLATEFLFRPTENFN